MSVCSTSVSSMACPRGQALLRGTNLHASAARAATPAVVQCRLRVPISATGRIQVRPARAHRRPRSPGAATRPRSGSACALFWATAQGDDCVYRRCRPWTDTACARCAIDVSPIVTLPCPRGVLTSHLGHLRLRETLHPRRGMPGVLAV